jgi:hypothetical protein
MNLTSGETMDEQRPKTTLPLTSCDPPTLSTAPILL